MFKLASAAALLVVLTACATPSAPSSSPADPYGSADDQRQRATRAVEELDRSVNRY